MDTPELPMLLATGIGGALSLLGFVALMLQRTDPQMKETVINVPFIGQMRTNVPALVFLVVGAALVLTGIRSRPPETVRWTVIAQFDTDVPLAQLIVRPSLTQTRVDPVQRTITIDVDLDKGKEFEDAIEVIDFTLPDGRAQLIPKDELATFEREPRHLAGRAAGLISMTKHTRSYRMVVTPMPLPLPERTTP